MPAVLLDRDGVINENRDGYVTSWDDFRFLPRSLEALAGLRSIGVRLAVVTNQSAVGRGLISRYALDEIHKRMQQECRSNNADIEVVFACPHTPDDGCDCRKPRPRMLQWALAALDEPAGASVAVGDSMCDLEAAEAANVPFVLVRTGHGEETLRSLDPRRHPGVVVARDLWEAHQMLHAHFDLQARPRAA